MQGCEIVTGLGEEGYRRNRLLDLLIGGHPMIRRLRRRRTTTVSWIRALAGERFAEADTDKAVQLRDEFRRGTRTLIAPDVFPIEVTHALTRAERSGRITPACWVIHLRKVMLATACSILHHVARQQPSASLPVHHAACNTPLSKSGHPAPFEMVELPKWRERARPR